MHTYDRGFMMLIVLSGYIGWIVFVSIVLLKKYTLDGSCIVDTPPSETLRLMQVLAVSIVFVIFQLDQQPIRYYVYVVFPVLFWNLPLVCCLILSSFSFTALHV
jgi:hypothetical protein